MGAKLLREVVDKSASRPSPAGNSEQVSGTLMPIGNTNQIPRFRRLPGCAVTGNSMRQQYPVCREMRRERNLVVRPMFAVLGSGRTASEVVW